MKNNLLLILSFLGLTNLLQAQTLDRQVINTTGGLLAPAGGPQLMVNTGESFVGTLTGGNYMLTEGFLQPQSILYIPAISGNLSLCIGGSTTLQDSLPGGNWSSSNTQVATIDANTGMVQTFSVGTTLISYSIEEVSVTATLVVHGLPTALASTTQSAICPNGNTTLSASGGVSYLWSNGDTATNTTVGQAGNYYVVASNQYGCADTSNLVAIVQKTLPTQVKIKTVGLSSVCYPALVSFVLDMPLGSTTGFAYQWYSQGSPISGATDSFYNANTTGSYALSVYGGDNCSKFSYAKPATIKPAPTASFTANSPTTICSGGFVTLVAPTISGCTYTWLKDGVAAGSGNTKLFKLSGNYTVIAKINGCSDTASPALPIIVNPLPVASVAAINATSFCSGDSCTIIASPTGAVSYEWHNGTFILDTTATEQFKVGVTATIKVLVKDANGCIGKLSATSVKTKVNAIPMASISSSGSTTISSIGSVKLKATPSSGVTWQWFKDGNAINNATANSYIANLGGNYTVAITKLGCTGLSSGVLVTQTNPKSEAVTVVNGSFEMTAYPNPVNDVLSINISGLELVDGTIMVMDYSGKLLTTQLMSTSTLNLDMKPFASGVYLIRYKGKDGKVSTLKVVKE